MKNFETLKKNTNSYVPSNVAYRDYTKKTSEALLVSVLETLSEEVKTSSKRLVFNFEFENRKSDETRLSYFRYYDIETSVPFAQLYAKYNGRYFDIVITKMYYDVFRSIFEREDIVSLFRASVPTFEEVNQKSHCLCSVPFEYVPFALRVVCDVRNEATRKTIMEDVEKYLASVDSLLHIVEDTEDVANVETTTEDVKNVDTERETLLATLSENERAYVLNNNVPTEDVKKLIAGKTETKKNTKKRTSKK